MCKLQDLILINAFQLPFLVSACLFSFFLNSRTGEVLGRRNDFKVIVDYARKCVFFFFAQKYLIFYCGYSLSIP